MSQESEKQSTVLWQNTNVTLVASYWLRTIAKYIIKEEVKTAPIQYMKITRQQSPLYSFHVISIIVAYSRLNIPIPYFQDDGPLVSHNNTTNDQKDTNKDVYDYEPTRTIIIEHGSSSIRAGFAGDDCPKICIPSLVAIVTNDNGKQEIIIGNQIVDDILKNEKPAIIKPVIERGAVVNYEYMTLLWKYVLRNIDIGSVYVHIVDPKALNTKKEFEKMTQIFFEDLKGAGFYISKSPVNSLYSSGHSTGLVVQCGYGLTTIAPIYEGYILPHATKQINYGRYDMDENNIKDYKIMFKEQKIGESIVKCIQKCDQDIRSDLFNNMIIAGGNSMYDDIYEFLVNEITNEMKVLNMDQYMLNMIVPPERAMSSWIGGSILGSVS